MALDALPLQSPMNCNDLERVLYPFLDGELDGDDALDIEQHLNACSACAGRVGLEQRLLSTLQSAGLGTQQAPEGLAARVRLGVSQQSRRASAARWLRVSAAAMVLVGVGAVAYSAYRPWARKRFVEDAALRHAKRYPLEIERPSPQEIEAWFGGKLDHRIAVPRFPNVVPVGARLLNVREKPAAYIRYDGTSGEARPGRMGLFVYGDKQHDADFDQMSAADMGSSHGFNVVSWREGDVVYQLVSDLDEADIRKMLAAEPLRAR